MIKFMSATVLFFQELRHALNIEGDESILGSILSMQHPLL